MMASTRTTPNLFRRQNADAGRNVNSTGTPTQRIEGLRDTMSHPYNVYDQRLDLESHANFTISPPHNAFFPHNHMTKTMPTTSLAPSVQPTVPEISVPLPVQNLSLHQTIFSGNVLPSFAPAPWTTLCVLTTPRHNASYLVEVLASIASSDPSAANLSGGVHGNVTVMVLHIEPAALLPGSTRQHDRADVAEARSRFPAFRIEPLRGRVWEKCTHEELLLDLGRPGNISCAVRQQSRDVVAGLAQCAAASPAAAWVVVIEDDTPVCPGLVSDVCMRMRRPE
jgi:hypothetical protein